MNGFKRMASAILAVAMTAASANAFMRGDINGDRIVDINDLNIMVDMVLGLDSLHNKTLADLSRDKQVDVADLNLAVNLVLGLSQPIEEKPRYMWIDASANFHEFADSKDNIRRDLKLAYDAGMPASPTWWSTCAPPRATCCLSAA